VNRVHRLCFWKILVLLVTARRKVRGLTDVRLSRTPHRKIHSPRTYWQAPPPRREVKVHRQNSPQIAQYHQFLTPSKVLVTCCSTPLQAQPAIVHLLLLVIKTLISSIAGSLKDAPRTKGGGALVVDLESTSPPKIGLVYLSTILRTLMRSSIRMS